jgi:fructosamine-3-kinase
VSGIATRGGRRVFVKSPRDPRARAMVEAEEHGLEFLRGRSSLRVPEVLERADDFLVLELLELGPLDGKSAEAFGRGLAELHRSGAPSYGLDRDNFIGLTEQANTPHARWADFYREERILAVASRCDFDRSVRALVDDVATRMDELVGAEEPPSRLHGDLWSGNACADAKGTPCIFDPAVAGGSRELDLAMMRLFGGFPKRAFDAYAESYPLLPGHEDRVALYQLYFLLVHVAIFGSGYVGQTERCLRTILR